MQSVYQTTIQQSHLIIYDPIDIGDPALWIPTDELELLLATSLKGHSLQGLPLRTRSKIVKSKVCEAMGYPVPLSFQKTQPRFPGQNLDIYTQKSRNLQIWNEEISPSRRYAIIAVDANDIVTTVKVVNGDALAKLDTTGTLTQKYQAGVDFGRYPAGTYLLTSTDTPSLQATTNGSADTPLLDPTSDPNTDSLLTIHDLFAKLQPLIGVTFSDLGSDQERNRAAIVHEYASQALGYALHQDNGQFPDIRHQLLEVKLQTSPTIDLGLVSPDSTELLDTKEINGTQARHCDVRYAIFGAKIDQGQVTITHLFLTTGADFFEHFRKFQGKVLNKKLQIPLPTSFF